MNLATRAFGMLGINFIQLVCWVLFFMSSDSTWSSVWVICAFTSKICLDLGWTLHAIRHPDLRPSHKMLWSISFFFAGALGVLRFFYWYRYVFGPYRIEKKYEALGHPDG